MSTQNNIYFKDFSTVIDFFYDYKVDEVTKFKSWKEGPPNERYTNYHIDFMAGGNGGDPGNAKFVCVLNKEPIYQISLLCEKKVLQMYWYEFEIIKPYILDSKNDAVKHYNFLKAIYGKYQSGEIKRRTNPFYFEFLKMYLNANKSTIEEIMTMSVKGKKQKGDWRNLLNTGKEFPAIDMENNKQIKNDILDTILLN